MGAWKAPDLPPQGGRGPTLSGLFRRTRRTAHSDADSAFGLASGVDGSASVGPDGDAQVASSAVCAEPAPNSVHAFGLTLRIKRPSAFGAAILAVVLGVAFVGVLTYYSARKFTRDAADLRASEEAVSLAEQGAYTSTGDAFNGYLQILRYAEDPVVRDMTSTREQRIAAMRELLYLNTNKLAALAIVARDGTIFAATDPSIVDVRDSEAFNKTRANLHPTNSDIVLPGDTGHGYVEFTAPLKLPDGAMWAILYARANPDVLWRSTLRTSVDGSRNVILNSEGLFAAGVPDEWLRQPWRGAPIENGGVRANIVGVDSICGLGPIGAQTQIDHGWHVASCLPIANIQTQADGALGQQLLVTAAGAVLAIVIAGGLLWVALDKSPAPAPAAGAGPVPQMGTDLVARLDRYLPAPPNADVEPDDSTVMAAESVATVGEEPAAAPEPAPEPEVVEPPPSPELPVARADVDALRLIDAYERRAARIARQLRESVQARLMIASAQADEAMRLYGADPESAAALHRASIDEIESVRDGELRNLGQEMHPGLVRLGLPGALRALQKELQGPLTLTLEVDPACDGVIAGAGRYTVAPQRRLAVFRAVRETLAALADGGTARCKLTLTRDGDWLDVAMTAPIDGSARFDEGALDASSIAFAAYGGRLSWSRGDDAIEVEGRLPAPSVALEDADDDAVDAQSEEDTLEDAGSDEQTVASSESKPIVTFAAALQDDAESLASALRELAQSMPQIAISLDIADEFEQPGALDGELAGALRSLVGTAVQTLVEAGARNSSVTLRRIHTDTYLSMMCDECGDGVDPTALASSRQAIEARGGQVSVGHFEGSMTITVEIPGQAAVDAPRVVQLERPPDGALALPGDSPGEDDAA